MIPDSFIDGFLTSGFLPNVKAITITSPSGTVTTGLVARREDTTEDMKAAAGVELGAESVTFFITVDQTGFVRPRNRWKITATGWDSQEWVVQGDSMVIQQRGVACVCTKQPA